MFIHVKHIYTMEIFYLRFISIKNVAREITEIVSQIINSNFLSVVGLLYSFFPLHYVCVMKFSRFFAQVTNVFNKFSGLLGLYSYSTILSLCTPFFKKLKVYLKSTVKLSQTLKTHVS